MRDSDRRKNSQSKLRFHDLGKLWKEKVAESAKREAPHQPGALADGGQGAPRETGISLGC